MTKHLSKLLLLLPLLCVAAIPLTPTWITLQWDGDPGWETNTVVKIYASTNLTLPMSSWTVVTNVAGTNRVSFQVVPGVRYYAATASNFWGESDFSNVVWTPPLPKGDNLNIRKGN